MNEMGFAQLAPNREIVNPRILVALRKGDSIAGIVDYLKKIAKPGTRIVFFIRRPVGDFEKTSRSRGRSRQKSRYLAERKQPSGPHAAENHRRWAKAKVLAACRPLRSGGADVSVQMYSGSFKRALKDFLGT